MAIYNGRILMRKGNEADFDPEKMMAGEWAISTDKRIVRMCVQAGVCIRMATYEAFEEDMEQIENILKECQDIEEAVSRINTEVSEKLNAVIEYVAQAKGYRDEAKSFRDKAEQYKNDAQTSYTNAKTSETNAKVSETNAKASETNAKLSEQTAQAVFESIPKDYSTISNDLYELAIKETASGEEIHVNDSSNLKLREFALYGKAKQNTTSGKNLFDYSAFFNNNYSIRFDVEPNKTLYRNGQIGVKSKWGVYDVNDTLLGTFENYNFTTTNPLVIPNNASYVYVQNDTSTKSDLYIGYDSDTAYEKYTGGQPSPNPQFPQPIEVSGESGSVEVKSCGKNLLNATLQTTTQKGITCTSNGDGTYTLNGTAEDSTDFYIVPNGMENNNVYDTSAVGKYLCGIRGKTTNRDYQITIYGMNGGRLAFLYSDSSTECVKIEETENIKFVYLWIYKGAIFNNVVIKPMITTDSTANYDSYEPYKETLATIPTENGLASVNDIRDVIVKYADGSGERIRKVGKEIFDGSEDEVWNIGESSGFHTASTPPVSNFKFVSNNSDNYMCSHFKAIKVNERYKDGTFFVNNAKRFVFAGNFFTTATEWKKWLANNPITVYYELEEPIHTPLTAEEIAEIEKLQTFYPVTNISNDFDCGMSVTYNADSKNYIDNKLKEQAQAREQAMMSMFLLLPEETQATMIENDVNNLLTESEV